MKNTSGIYYYNITKTESYTMNGALAQVKECMKNGCNYDMTIQDEHTGELMIHIENGNIVYMSGSFTKALYDYLVS